MNEIAWCWAWPDMKAELQVGRQVSEMFGHYRQSQGENERGGQLFVDPANPGGIVLCHASAPHPADRAGRTWLELNNDRCRTEIENANRKGLRLVGYWHTHPQAVPHISGTDIASFARFARQNARDLPPPVAVIVGTSPSTTGIKAWIFREGRYQEAVYTASLSRP